MCNWRKVTLCGYKFQVLILVVLLIPVKSEESDECKAGEWRCGDRSCARVGATCDGALDCDDGSDEGLLLCRDTKRPLLGLLLLCLESWSPLQAALCPEACRKWPDYCYYVLSAEHGEPGTCKFPPFPTVGDYSITDIVPRGVGPADFSLLYSCPAGYRLLGKNPRCIEGIWSGRFPSCVSALYSAVSSDGGGEHGCSAFQFPCENGACVRREQRCDGAVDCADASDELKCDEPPTGSCVLPEYPEHGKYIVNGIPDAKPGQRYQLAMLTVTCDPGYGVVGSNTTDCFSGNGWLGPMPSCSRLCKLTPHPSVNYKCKRTGDEELSGTRLCHEYEPSGTVVIPACNHPDYFYNGFLEHMHCIDGNWNYTAICQPGTTAIFVINTTRHDSLETGYCESNPKILTVIEGSEVLITKSSSYLIQKTKCVIPNHPNEFDTEGFKADAWNLRLPNIPVNVSGLWWCEFKFGGPGAWILPNNDGYTSVYCNIYVTVKKNSTLLYR